jgi:5'(3')-deoxyribonucleotidase
MFQKRKKMAESQKNQREEKKLMIMPLDPRKKKGSSRCAGIGITLLLCVSILVSTEGLARDINLDSIYINDKSFLLRKLLEKKLDLYQSVRARFVDRNVIFAYWINGFEVAYIKEFPKMNVVYIYHRNKKKRREIARLPGAITAVKVSPNGKYCVIKRIIMKSNSIPAGDTTQLNLVSKKMKKLEPAFPFIDFSLSPGGNSILYGTRKGIVEHFPESGIKNIILKRTEYVGIVKAGSPTIAYLSPNRKKILVINGSGGLYRSKLLLKNKSRTISGISSGSEIFWIDNRYLVYRGGQIGSFSAILYDTKKGRSRKILSGSLNTNIYFSRYPKIISMLKDQLIQVYSFREQKMIYTGMEGEDIHFSPDGNRFISLFLNKLFITNLTTMTRSSIEKRKVQSQILNIYQDLLTENKDWANRYSKQYIRRKIAVYRKVVQ